MTMVEPPFDHTATLDVVAPRRTLWSMFTRSLVVVALGLLIAMWVYGLFFASKEGINRINDRDWPVRAQAICQQANAERRQLTDLRRLDEVGPGALAGRAALVDRATDIVTRMLDEVVAVAPTDAKGRDLIPMWEAEYRVYLNDRRDYADLLRSGVNRPFAETRSEGLPISERLETFAGDNEMPACAPPRDLVN
jgi:hypothetical protein